MVQYQADQRAVMGEAGSFVSRQLLLTHQTLMIRGRGSRLSSNFHLEGRIWSWFDTFGPAIHVKFLHVDINEVTNGENGTRNRNIDQSQGRVRRVVAGWDTSSAYVSGTGILIWAQIERPRERNGQVTPQQQFQDEDSPDVQLIPDSVVIPKTSFVRSTAKVHRNDELARYLGDQIGEVLNHVVLENAVVFITDLGKAFASRIKDESGHVRADEPVELPRFLADQTLDNLPSAVHVQGAFRHFGIFYSNGEVIIVHGSYLSVLFSNDPSTALSAQDLVRKIPALQNTGVISLAFGDWHFHALHSSGRVTSYDHEPQLCGTLGLGGLGCGWIVDCVNERALSMLRGISTRATNWDGALLPICNNIGRQVWFEPEKLAWLAFMATGGCNAQESRERFRMTMSDLLTQAEVSEWIEQEGRAWDEVLRIDKLDEDGLGAYFVLGIAASGWHSGALVLVNDTLTEQIRAKCMVRDDAASGDRQVTTESSNTSDLSPTRTTPIQTSGFFNGILNWGERWGRWFLGLPAPADQAHNRPNAVAESNVLSSSMDDFLFSEDGKESWRYVWADMPFPRLQLSDGREMPGTIPFSKWRTPRPSS
jgi:SCF-associated factor 1